MKLDAFTPQQRAAIQAEIDASPGFRLAEWTGLGIKQALRWKHDGHTYSCSGLTWKILNDLGLNPGAIAGPDYWLAPSGRSLYEEAIAVDAQSASVG